MCLVYLLGGLFEDAAKTFAKAGEWSRALSAWSQSEMRDKLIRQQISFDAIGNLQL